MNSMIGISCQIDNIETLGFRYPSVKLGSEWDFYEFYLKFPKRPKLFSIYHRLNRIDDKQGQIKTNKQETSKNYQTNFTTQ